MLRTGYRPLPAHDAFASERRQAETRRMLWRLGWPGLSHDAGDDVRHADLPGDAGEIEPDLINLLRWAQWVLSIPVLLFSCQPFFAQCAARPALGRVSMDLPVALGMLITFVVSSLATFEPDGLFGREVYFDSLTMFVFFLLTGRWLELRLRDRTAGALEALMHRLPDSVRRTGDGTGSAWSVRRVRVADVLRVLPGEVFLPITTVLRGAGRGRRGAADRRVDARSRGVGDTVIAGSHNPTAPVEMQVEQVGQDTRYAQIVALMAQASTSKPQIALLADRLAKPSGKNFIRAGRGRSTARWWPSDPGHALMIAVAILVVTLPVRALSLADPGGHAGQRAGA